MAWYFRELEKILRLPLLLVFLALPACDEENSALLGGGPGGSANNPTDMVASGDGFCDPAGGLSALGSSPSFSSGPTEAKLDFDGDPNGQTDPYWQATTAATVNGNYVNSKTYNYVVMSPRQMAASGVSLGDWATVSNASTGKTVFAKVSDIGPDGGVGEVSESVASNLGIQFLPSSATIGSNTILVNAFAGTSGISSDCPQSNVANNP
jgi:hypothetical protein